MVSRSSFLTSNVYPVWTYCDQFSPMVSYIDECNLSGNRLTASGFDVEFDGKFSQENFRSNFTQFLADCSILVDSTLRLIIDTVVTSVRRRLYICKGSLDRLTTFLANSRDSLYKVGTPGIWEPIIGTLIAHAKEVYYSQTDFYNSMEIREEQMAANLHWLLTNKFKGQKVIVWSANSHIERNSSSNLEKSFGTYISMNEYLMRRMNGSLIYCLGFASREGESGTVFQNKYSISQPKDTSYENWMNNKFEYAFTNFKAVKLSYPKETPMFYMSGSDHVTLRGKWLDIYDGMFYIRVQHWCVILPYFDGH